MRVDDEWEKFGGTSIDLSGYAPKESPIFTGSVSLGRKANTTIGTNSFAVGVSVEASGTQSHAEGADTIASGAQSHAEGASTTASGVYAHAEGAGTTASGAQSHAEGVSTTASGIHTHAEGAGTIASGDQSHAEGGGNIAMGAQSHAEGANTQAIGLAEHVSGRFNFIDSAPTWTASKSYEVNDLVSREQTLNVDNNTYARTIIYKCITANSDASFNSSKWTEWGQYLVVVGNGTNSTRSNAYALDWEGNGYFAGDIYVGCDTDSTDGIKLPRIPEAPSTDGIYTLQATVSNGTVTYSWIAGA